MSEPTLPPQKREPPVPDPLPNTFPHRRRRNWAVFLALLAFIILIYAVTIVKIKLGYGP